MPWIRRAVAILTVMVALSAWLAVSNHCALGAIASGTKPSAEECPFHAQHHAPAKPKQTDHSPCCKILRATAAVPAKRVAAAMVDLLQGNVLFAQIVLIAPSRRAIAPASLDTGPPGKTSFVQWIGSVRAHAPPLLA